MSKEKARYNRARMTSPDQQRVSDQLVRLVQVFFVLVLGQSLVLFKPVLVNPFVPGHRLAAVAWATVFYTTIASWVDWHVVMTRRPYDTRQFGDRFRFYSDVGIAVLYAYLLFTIEPLVGNPCAPLGDHLLGYPLVFLLYLTSGLLRQWTHGKGTSKPRPQVAGLVAYVALLVAYRFASSRELVDAIVLNAGALSAAFVLMFTYRSYRRRLSEADERRAERLTIGIDVDGVLADQISGVLPLIRQRHDVALAYADITDWRLPIKATNIADEIVLAQQSREYVLSMKAHEGAKRVLDFLHDANRLVVITARQGEAAAWTAEWLQRNEIPYDEVVPGGEARKSVHLTDVLIDDYLGNILEFLENTNGVAVLVDQPWNRDRLSLRAFIEAKRLFVVSSLLELRMLWADISDRARAVKARR